MGNKTQTELVGEFILLLGEEKQKSNEVYVSITISDVMKRLNLTREEFDLAYRELIDARLAVEDQNIPFNEKYVVGKPMRLRLTSKGDTVYKELAIPPKQRMGFDIPPETKR